MYKVGLSLIAALLATVVAARLAFEATVNTASEPVNQPWAQGTMQFVTWNHEKWSAWIRDDAFEQLPQNTDKWNRHTNASLAFIDWEGRAWQAKIDGDDFLLAHRGDWAGATERAVAIRYRDWQGKNKLRTTVQLRR
ncbi:MAG: hypothetical protein O7F73_03880 [Gammaproteobacteria bacterium]|nr:hypothetical protein [Gammaproteobacteria bacterium]